MNKKAIVVSPFCSIQVGDSVTISTPQGQERKGRAVMRGAYGWVCNAGGRHGTPIIADIHNTVKVRKAPVSRQARYSALVAANAQC